MGVFKNKPMKHKYFKIVEQKNKAGEIKFVLFGTCTKFEYIFGLWDEYQLQHNTLNDAFAHVERLQNRKVVEAKTVAMICLN